MERIEQHLKEICALVEKNTQLEAIARDSLARLQSQIERERMSNISDAGPSDSVSVTSNETPVRHSDRKHRAPPDSTKVEPAQAFDFSINAMLNPAPSAGKHNSRATPSPPPRDRIPDMVPVVPLAEPAACPPNLSSIPPLIPYQPGPWPMVVVPPVSAPGPIEISVAWAFLCNFFGMQLKFPALMRLIEEIRSVKMIPFSKNKKMRKVDLVKWLDDHWVIILPFFQSLTPEGRARLHGYLHAKL